MKIRTPPAITIFLSECSASERTKRSYESVLRPFAVELEELEIHTITPSTINNYLNSKTISQSTFARYRATFSVFFGFAIEKGWTSVTPINKSLRRKFKEEEVHSDENFRYFTNDETKELLTATAQSPRLHAIAQLARDSGCRIDEMLRLDLADIALGKGYLTVRGKGRKVRRCYFGQTAIQAIDRYQSHHRQPHNQALFSHLNRRTGKIERASYSHLAYEWRKTLATTPFGAEIAFHRIRHTFATERLSQDMPLPVLQALMGHEDISTTLRYAKITSTKAEVEARKALAMLGGG
jgi:integrase/recombinase XerD